MQTILSVVHIHEAFDPYRKVVRLDSAVWKSRFFSRQPLSTLRDIAEGFKIWFISLTDHRPGPVLTYGLGSGWVFASLQWLASPIKRRRTHFMFDLLLNPKRSGIAGLVDSIKAMLLRSVIDRAFVWGMTDVGAYANSYDIPPDKFTFHHYHTTLDHVDYTVSDGGFIFAGGNALRDYRTLIEAAGPLGYPVFIATTLPGIAEMARPFPHIQVQGVTHEEYCKRIAECTAFVECHISGLFRCVGHQTFLNAMTCAKPVLIADRASALGYVEHEIDGLVVDAGDVDDLRGQLARLIADKDLRERLGRAALAKVKHSYSKAATFQSIYNIMLDFDVKRSGYPAAERICVF